ncbi:hypothetical protein [Pseudomonas thivervalensis]|uniref:hypothetical protein n=1 Tax=Pseudomonas thivervalensis TaxID=86265 RepID=UPI00069CCCE2|nr:hypothetical protein [Pseudomonas thivervalensis]
MDGFDDEILKRLQTRYRQGAVLVYPFAGRNVLLDVDRLTATYCALSEGSRRRLNNSIAVGEAATPGGMEDAEYLFTLYELIVPLSKRYN